MPTYKIEELCSRTYTELREEMDKEFPNALAKDLNEKNMTDYQLALSSLQKKTPMLKLGDEF